jgi:uncharacterized protein (TIGR00730 family)
MRELTAVAVYCGSSPGFDLVYAQAAGNLGITLAERGVHLVYGGGRVGLMGVLADAVLSGGGEVHGVLPRALERKELTHRGLTSLAITETMHERKALMADKADAFIMLPGGFGTFDEFFEVVTWTQLGIHAKPCGVLDVAGYFAPLRAQMDAMTSAGFLRPQHRDMVIIDSDPGALLDRLDKWSPPQVQKWMDSAGR